ncbi:outer membrane protein 100 [Pasteurella multocida subsp. multocida OH4807]|nr:outer membrane protein 100 [Pasteurella multocida subsp. multocida OH4807]
MKFGNPKLGAMIISTAFLSGNVFADGVNITDNNPTLKADPNGGIAIGQNATAHKPVGLSKLLGLTEAGIAIGKNANANAHGIHIGSSKTQRTTVKTGAIVVGSESYTDGLGSTVIGTNSKIDGIAETGSQRGAAAVISGAYNTIKADDKSKKTDGLATIINGIGNKIEHSNGVIISGAGNKVVGSYKESKVSIISGASANDFIKEELGSISINGGGNTVEYALLSSVNGVQNKLTGKNSKFSEKNQINGYKNSVDEANNTIVNGSNNTIEKGKNSLIFGDNHKVIGNTQEQNANNIIIGYNDKEKTYENIKNVVLMGSNITVKANTQNTTALGTDTVVNTDNGVALGSHSVADRVSVVNATSTQNPIYSPKDTTDEDQKAVKNTVKGSLAAVSVGNINATRQIINVAAGSADSDAVNVAQLKAAVNQGNNRINSLKVVIDKHDGIITAHETAIQTHENAIREHKGVLDTHETAIQTHENAIREHKGVLDTHETAIREHKGVLDTHETAIQTHENAIREHKGVLDTHETAIREHKGVLDTHETAIQTHENAIREHKGVLDTHETAIREHKGVLDTHETAIREHKGVLDTHETAIQTHENAIREHKGVLDTHETAIREHKGVLDIHKSELRIHEKSILENRANIDILDKRVDYLHTELKNGLATQAALNGLFQPYSVGKFNMSVAVGGYRDRTALAVGMGYRFNEKVAAKAGMSTSTSGGGMAYNVGVNFEF